MLWNGRRNLTGSDRILPIDIGHESSDLEKRYYEHLDSPLLASAGLDRLLHHAEPAVIITGPSFRAQGRQQLEQEVFIEDQTRS